MVCCGGASLGARLRDKATSEDTSVWSDLQGMPPKYKDVCGFRLLDAGLVSEDRVLFR